MTTDAGEPVRRHRRLLRWGLPMLAVAGAGLAVVVVAGRGSDGGSRAAADTSRSSTIAWSSDERALWITSPDDDQLVAIDPRSLEPIRSVPVWGQPQDLTVLGDTVVATARLSTDLAVVDLAPGPEDTRARDGATVDPVALPCGGSAGVVTVPEGEDGPPRDLAVVTCPNDDRIAVVDLGRREAVGWIALAGRPTGIVRDGATISVSTTGDGRVHALAIGDLVEALADAPAVDPFGPEPSIDVRLTSSARAWVDGDRTASLLRALTPGPSGPLGAYQVVDNERRLTEEEIRSGSTYGTPDDGRARLEPAIAGACGARFASLSDEARRLSGPVALAAGPTDDLVWVVGELSHSVSVVRCGSARTADRSPTVAAFDIGEGGRGIVLSPDGRRAFVDVGFDHEVAALRLPDGAADLGGGDPIERTDPERVGRRQVEDRYLSPLAQQGRRTFNDATNAHLTPFGVVACGSCHPSAGEDGLSWRIESVDEETGGIERKVRRTPPAWQVDPAVKPLHWDGGFTSSDDLSLDTVQRLLGGDGLMVDASAISAYMAEVAAPPGAPVDDDTPDGPTQRGEEVAATKGCTDCHTGPVGTDGKAHDVLSRSKVRDADLDVVITPPLRAVRGRAPYGHDGRAPTLEALLAEHGDGRGHRIELTPEELAAVLAYLDSR